MKIELLGKTFSTQDMVSVRDELRVGLFLIYRWKLEAILMGIGTTTSLVQMPRIEQTTFTQMFPEGSEVGPLFHPT